MTIQPISNLTSFQPRLTAEEYAKHICYNNLAILDIITPAELYMTVRREGLPLPLLALIMTKTDEAFQEKAWTLFLDKFSIDEWLKPCEGVPLVLFATSQRGVLLGRVWHKFSSHWSWELLSRKFEFDKIEASIWELLLTSVVHSEVWNLIKEHVTFDDLTGLLYKRSQSHLELLLQNPEKYSEILNQIFTKFSDQLCPTIFYRKLNVGASLYFSGTLGDKLLDASDRYPQYVLQVWQKMDLGLAFSRHHIPQLGVVVGTHRPDLFPVLVEKICTEAPSYLHAMKFTEETWSQFHTALEDNSTNQALFMCSCGKEKEFVHILATKPVDFSSAQFEYLTMCGTTPYALAKANSEFTQAVKTLDDKPELTMSELDKLLSLADVAEKAGYINAYYYLALFLENHPGFEEQKLEAYAKVPKTSEFYKEVLLKLQAGYFSLTFTSTEADKKGLLKKSLRYALLLPKNTRDMATQEIASHYIGLAPGASRFERDIIAEPIMNVLSHSTKTSTFFSVFDDIKKQNALEEKKQQLQAQNQKLAKQIAALKQLCKSEGD